MAQEKKEINIKDLTVDELKVRLKEAREKLFRLKFSHKTTSLKNPLVIRATRRDVARLLTVIKQKAAAGK
jgi:large subunit ribosomal protein L29